MGVPAAVDALARPDGPRHLRADEQVHLRHVLQEEVNRGDDSLLGLDDGFLLGLEDELAGGSLIRLGIRSVDGSFIMRYTISMSVC